jgi:hypothetical protein
VRRSVAAGSAALLAASFGAVAGWGRQPPARHRAAAAVTQKDATPAPQQQDPNYDDPYGPQGTYGGQDPYNGQDPNSGQDPYNQAPPATQAAPQDAAPAPLTTRQS